MQQAFDSKVLGVFFENARLNCREVARYADRYYTRCKWRRADPKLDDWHSADLSGFKSGEAIPRCQR